MKKPWYIKVIRFFENKCEECNQVGVYKVGKHRYRCQKHRVFYRPMGGYTIPIDNSTGWKYNSWENDGSQKT